MKTQTIFELADPVTRDSFVIEYDRKGDRLLIRSAIDGAGERCMVVIDAARVGRQLADAIVAALAGLPPPAAPKPRATKLPRKVAL